MSDKKRLLLVNDDMAGRDVFERIFSRRGIDAVMTASAEEAVRLAKESRFDLIVTDMALQDGEKAGLDVVRRIRQFDKNVKIIVATGAGDIYKNEVMAAGATAYFEKPYVLDKVFFEPLGVKSESIPEPKSEVKMTATNTLRWAMHETGNKHNCVIMISSLLTETLRDFIKKEKLSGKVKDVLEKAVEDLTEIEKSGKEGDDLLKKARNAVYKRVNPDEVAIGE